MPEPTLQEQLDALQRENAALQAQVDQHQETSKRLTQQVETLRTGMGGLSSLPEDVQRDARERIAAGIPKEVAIERALTQAAHNKAIKESDEPVFVHLRSNVERIENYKAEKAKTLAAKSAPATPPTPTTGRGR